MEDYKRKQEVEGVNRAILLFLIVTHHKTIKQNLKKVGNNRMNGMIMIIDAN